jgi:ribokinase
MHTAVVVGSLNMDLVVRTERMPSPGETVRGKAFRTIPGGKGANQAAAIALLGAEVAMVGRVGEDAFGPKLVENMASKGVDTAHILSTPDVASGNAMIIVDAHGQNSIVIAAGANGQVSRQDVDACEAILCDADYLVLQLEIPLETVSYAAEKAAACGTPVMLNPAPAAPIPESLLRQVAYLVPNETEAQTLTGVPVNDLASAEQAARQLQAQGVPVVIVTLGERGALLLTEEKTVHVPAPQVEAVDTTAAGDAFIGGLVAGLSQGKVLEDAVRYACCAGALAVTRFGAQPSLPSASDVQSLYARSASSER